MDSYFAYDYGGAPFELFGTGHLVALAVIAGVVSFLIWGWRNPGEDAKRRVRLLLVAIFLLNEAGWHSWHLLHGSWTIREHIPFHLCGVSIWSSIFILLTRNYRLFEIVFFFGIAGATQALITPPAGEYGFPHFRAFQTLVSHGMIVVAMVYMTAIEGFRPTWGSIMRAMIFLNVYLVFVSAVNYGLGSNYMYTMGKPATASILDLMGPWPWYLVAAEVLALVIFVLLYLPFALADRRRAVNSPAWESGSLSRRR